MRRASPGTAAYPLKTPELLGPAHQSALSTVGSDTSPLRGVALPLVNTEDPI